MAYGYRLNIEDIFFDLAENNFNIAESLSGRVKHESCEGNDDSFIGYPTVEGLAAVSIALVAWSTALESFVNLAINRCDSCSVTNTKDLLIKECSTKEKLKHILVSNNVVIRKLGWWPHLNDLYELRNELVHYKDTMKFQGFCFAPQISIAFKKSRIHKIRQAVFAVIELIGQLCGLRTTFLQKQYEFADVNE